MSKIWNALKIKIYLSAVLDFKIFHSYTWNSTGDQIELKFEITFETKLNIDDVQNLYKASKNVSIQPLASGL